MTVSVGISLNSIVKTDFGRVRVDRQRNVRAARKPMNATRNGAPPMRSGRNVKYG
jgi:hypothetical protein